MKYVSASEAVKSVLSGDNIYVHSGASTPNILTKALTERAEELRGVNFYHIHTFGEAPYADPKYAESFHVNSFFIGANVRHTIAAGNGSYIPVFLSQVSVLFRKRIIPIDVALIHVSPPDEHGYCSLGVSLDTVVSAIESARVVIAQVNKFMPRTFGDGVIHHSKIDFAVEHNSAIHEVILPQIKEVEDKVSEYVASLIEDESTLQLGIGSIPEAVLSKLKDRKDLGLHTEMFSDGVVDLIENGNITCTKKGVLKGRATGAFLTGSERLYKFVDNNPFIELREACYTNDPHIISQNPKMIAVNSAVEVDVTGQVCADSIGSRMYSGVGGQVDFVRGATLSEGGKAIIALTSTTNSGANKIVPFLKSGAGVVTSRAHVQYIVTEYGIADLFGKSLSQRVKALAEIAHPDYREEILKTYFDSIKSPRASSKINQ